MGVGLPAVAAWPSANRAMYVPFVVETPFLAQMMFVLNGTVAGNVDVGIYNDEGKRIVSKGTTAQAGATLLQSFDITDTVLLPGVYYMAMASDSASGQYMRWSINASATTGAQMAASMGVLQQASAFVLPATATFAVAQDSYVPDIGLLARTLV